MKKTVFTAALAALALSAAQAVSLDWTYSAEEWAPSSGKYSLGTAIAVGMEGTFAVAMDVATLGAGAILSCADGTGANANNRITLALVDKEGGGYEWNITTSTQTNVTVTYADGVAAPSTGLHAFAFSIDRKSNDELSTVTVTMDGTELATVTMQFTTGPIRQFWWGQAYDGDTSTAFGGEAEYLAYYLANAAATPEEIGDNMVPEPTALALLALGAVGMALRRRVA